jgi:predicted nucleic acid-binding protein
MAHVEDQGPWSVLKRSRLDGLTRRRRSTWFFAVTHLGHSVLEVLVVPFRAGDLALAARYEGLLTRSRGLRLVDADRKQMRAAAQLRAAYGGLKTPDALQLCAALAGGCTSFVTNDRKLPAVPGLRILQINDYLKAKA